MVENPKRTETNEGEDQIRIEGSVMNPVHISRQVIGIAFFIAGLGCAWFAHYALLWKVHSWILGKRLAIGVPGWSLAVVFLWHGISLLTGI